MMGPRTGIFSVVENHPGAKLAHQRDLGIGEGNHRRIVHKSHVQRKRDGDVGISVLDASTN